MKHFGWTLLAFSFLQGVVSPSEAQSAERVAVFAVLAGQENPDLLIPMVHQARAHSLKAGHQVVWPKLSRQGEALATSDAKALGRTVVRELASRPPESVLTEYDPQIRRVLQSVTSTLDVEGRAHLWNLCALGVHVLVVAGRDDSEVRQAVLDCRRRFAERPPLDERWGKEVALAFEAHSAEVPSVSLSVKSAPAGCDLRVYGSLMGVTPVVVDVVSGAQELQVVCNGRRSAIHRLDVTAGRDLVIRVDADDALSVHDGTAWLRYQTDPGAEQRAEDAAVLAAEAEADSFVLISAAGTNVHVAWVRFAPLRRSEGVVAATASHDERAAFIEHLLGRGPSFAGVERSQRRPWSRSWQDYALGGGLVLAGTALAVAPLLSIARDGQCVKSGCAEVYRGDTPAGYLALAGAGVLVAAGIGLVWVGPFGPRQENLWVSHGGSGRFPSL